MPPVDTASPSASLVRLYTRTAHGIKLGLEYVEALLEALGNPQAHAAPVHVAGTNGKGSVCAMLESVLRCAGYRTGLYTSPHLVRFNERIRVDGRCIPDGDLDELLQRVDACDREVAARPGGREATFFEFATAMAFEYFRRQQVQVPILETGLGGRLDATNVVTPQVSIITSIGLDHTGYLGKTVEEVAREKGGIIKEGRAVVCAPMDRKVRAVIERVARERHAPFIAAEEAVSVRRLGQTLQGQRVRVETARAAYGPFALPLTGQHQLENCALAVAALEVLSGSSSFRLGKDAMEAGLAAVRWPARTQVLSVDPLVILDAAHNPAGAAALLATLQELAPDRELGLVVSFSADKDATAFLKTLAPRVKRCWAVPMENERAMAPAELLTRIRAAGVEPVPCSLSEAMDQAGAWARADARVVCVAGSIYLAGEVLRALGQVDVFRESLSQSLSAT